MAIQKLPQYLINQLKAGEIVERPASIVKELIENSLDACATELVIELSAWGKDRIIVRDNGSWVDKDNLPRMIERYATSKIHEADDLLSLDSYGFRGEALSAIAEVSTFVVQTKVIGDTTGCELKRQWSEYAITPVAFAWEHGTHVIVDKLFASIPVREKYLKSDATEWKYIRQLIITYSLIHFDKIRTLIHNNKQAFHLPAHTSVMERAGHLFQVSRESKRTPFEYKDQQLHCRGLRGDASLHFPTSQHVYLVVNGRTVTDKLLRKAVLTAYQRQIVPWSYPFVILFLEVDPAVVDVNVHPRKMEVTFLDPWSIFNLVKQTIWWSLGDQKVSYSAFNKNPIQGKGRNKSGEWRVQNGEERKWWVWSKQSDHIISGMQQFGQRRREQWWVQDLLLTDRTDHEWRSYGGLRLGGHEIQIVWQLHAMYILAESQQWMILIDQHALAERVTFEKMRTETKQKGFTPEVMLTPLTIDWVLSDTQTTVLNQIGFDVSAISAKKSVIYAIPSIFQKYSIDLWLLLQCLEWIDLVGDTEPYAVFGLILDEIMWMKACKASIKAWQRLSTLEMEQLIRDASGIIDGLFVCQHGRPSVVLIPKNELDGLFDRH